MVRQSFAFHTAARVVAKSRPLRRVRKAGLAWSWREPHPDAVGSWRRCVCPRVRSTQIAHTGAYTRSVRVEMCRVGVGGWLVVVGEPAGLVRRAPALPLGARTARADRGRRRPRDRTGRRIVRPAETRRRDRLRGHVKAAALGAGASRSRPPATACVATRATAAIGRIIQRHTRHGRPAAVPGPARRIAPDPGTTVRRIGKRGFARCRRWRSAVRG